MNEDLSQPDPRKYIDSYTTNSTAPVVSICPSCGQEVTAEFQEEARLFNGKMYHCQYAYYEA